MINLRSDTDYTFDPKQRCRSRFSPEKSKPHLTQENDVDSAIYLANICRDQFNRVLAEFVKSRILSNTKSDVDVKSCLRRTSIMFI